MHTTRPAIGFAEVKVFPQRRALAWIHPSRSALLDAGAHTDPSGGSHSTPGSACAGPLAEIAFEWNAGLGRRPPAPSEIVLAQGLVSLAAVKLGTDAQSLVQVAIAETCRLV
ncbi:MAG: hypothetical protein MZV65_27310 [Chromatiales bacterium]|nr:hypothetical protein [Chromatiales bacterium]